MTKEKGTCKKCGKERYIVNKTRHLCNACNKARLESRKEPYNSFKLKSGTTPSKRVKIAHRSSNRLKEEDWYRQTKAQKKKDMIEGGYFKCFFSNKPLDPNVEHPWHHTLGRRGVLLYEYKNIFPAISKYHQEYHDLDAERLMKTDWYKDFLKRIKSINHRVYNKELDRLKKAGVISMETFIDEFI